MASKEQASKTTDNTEEKAPSMLPLFYTSPAPLDKVKHVNLGLNANFSLDFAKGINAVPVNLIELPQICHYYPVAFSPDENATPVAILGLRDKENLFVNEKGEWAAGTYIPAYIRRYPFIFSELPNTEQLTLCVDMNDKVVSEDSTQKFFNEDGTATDLATNALEFCKSYHAAAQQTIEFSKALAESGLLVDRQAEIEVKGGKRISFSGFRILDEKKFTSLSDEEFLKWRQKGWLPFLYAHLFSGGQWQRLTRLLGERESA